MRGGGRRVRRGGGGEAVRGDQGGRRLCCAEAVERRGQGASCAQAARHAARAAAAGGGRAGAGDVPSAPLLPRPRRRPLPPRHLRAGAGCGAAGRACPADGCCCGDVGGGGDLAHGGLALPRRGQVRRRAVPAALGPSESASRGGRRSGRRRRAHLRAVDGRDDCALPGRGRRSRRRDAAGRPRRGARRGGLRVRPRGGAAPPVPDARGAATQGSDHGAASCAAGVHLCL
mmetsp:Transcript_16895/g.51297  ORF Transcript_16895/g.51297 Transcript_16895/m.51297 type:complete len:230 (+) Transcript_16895:1012-1701(+)